MLEYSHHFEEGDMIDQLFALRALDTRSHIIGFALEDSIYSDVAVYNCPALRDLSFSNTSITYLRPEIQSLQSIKCVNNPLLWELSLYECPSLKKVECSGNRSLKRLILSNNYGLEEVVCTYNDSLESPELPAGSSLKTVDYSNNAQLKYLGLEQQSALTMLKCTDNPLLESLGLYGCLSIDSFYFSNNVQLKDLVLENTGLRTLDLSVAPNLEDLACYGNDSLTTLSIDNPKLEYLSLHDLPALQYLSCRNTLLSSLSFSAYGSLPSLRTVECSDNPLLESLELTDCPSLQTVEGTNNPLLKSLELTDCPLLDALNFSNNAQLDYLNISNTGLSSLDLSVAPNLENVSCSGNDSLATLSIDNPKLEYLSLHDLPALQYLSCRNTLLSALHFTASDSLPSLRTVECTASPLLESLKLTDWPSLQTVKCTDNPLLESLELIDCPSLDALDFSSNAQLGYLAINNTKLRALDLSVAPNLEKVYCDRNDSLTMLKVDNPVLKDLQCDHNRLDSLLINGTALANLTCNHNRLTSLSLPSDVILESLTCDSNGLQWSVLTDLVKQTEYTAFNLISPQFVPALIQVGQTLDLHGEMRLDDDVLDSQWVLCDSAGNREIPYRDILEYNVGRFSFKKPGQYRIEVNHYDLFSHSGVAHNAQIFYDVTVVDSVARPVFSEPSGAVKRHTPVSLSTTTPDARIYYTMDGSAPDSTASLYTDPIYIDEAVTIKAIAMQDTFASRVATASYKIKIADTTIDNEYDVLASQVRIYVKNKTIHVPETIGAIEIFTMGGQCVYRGSATAIPVKRSGLYVVVAKGGRWKVAVR